MNMLKSKHRDELNSLTSKYDKEISHLEKKLSSYKLYRTESDNYDKTIADAESALRMHEKDEAESFLEYLKLSKNVPKHKQENVQCDIKSNSIKFFSRLFLGTNVPVQENQSEFDHLKNSFRDKQRRTTSARLLLAEKRVNKKNHVIKVNSQGNETILEKINAVNYNYKINKNSLIDKHQKEINLFNKNVTKQKSNNNRSSSRFNNNNSNPTFSENKSRSYNDNKGNSYLNKNSCSSTSTSSSFSQHSYFNHKSSNNESYKKNIDKQNIYNSKNNSKFMDQEYAKNLNDFEANLVFYSEKSPTEPNEKDSANISREINELYDKYYRYNNGCDKSLIANINSLCNKYSDSDRKLIKRRLQVKFHPDKNPNMDAKEIFHKIQVNFSK